MGHRVVPPKPSALTFGFSFTNYGSHIEDYPYLPYLTVACGIGMK